jgi:flagellar biosynthesis/type III secretory pathway ATPase
MVGLGDTCLIGKPEHNLDECSVDRSNGHEPLLGEVVAVDEAGVHLLPFSELDGIGLGARVTPLRGLQRIRPGRIRTL